MTRLGRRCCSVVQFAGDYAPCQWWWCELAFGVVKGCGRLQHGRDATAPAEVHLPRRGDDDRGVGGRTEEGGRAGERIDPTVAVVGRTGPWVGIARRAPLHPGTTRKMLRNFGERGDRVATRRGLRSARPVHRLLDRYFGGGTGTAPSRGHWVVVGFFNST